MSPSNRGSGFLGALSTCYVTVVSLSKLESLCGDLKFFLAKSGCNGIQVLLPYNPKILLENFGPCFSS